MLRHRPAFLPIVALALATPLAAAHPPAPAYGGLLTDYAYAELADLALAAPIVLAADIDRATALKPDAAPGLGAGRTRYFVEASVRGLIGGRAAVPATIRYLVDLPLANAKLKATPVLLFASLSDKPGEIRLVSPRAQVPRTPENEARVRAILTASVAPDAPPAITGIARAFHVAGSLPGEGETQIFLRTADARPISLSGLRRPGETPRWAVALTELVDDSAAPPKPDSFLWYHLACGLPRALPDAAVAGLEGGDATQARTDYRVVLDGLGPCNRAHAG